MESTRSLIKCFDPVSDPAARKLILGTIPGRISLELNQYYGHPRNVFWRIIEALLSPRQGLAYPERRRLLIDSGIALWDVLRAADRAGSLDSGIDPVTAVPNDLPGFFRLHPLIHTVYFNGMNAHNLFRKYFKGGVTERIPLHLVVLPSTSPANARMTGLEKTNRWRRLLE